MMFASLRSPLFLSLTVAGLALSFGMADQTHADCVQSTEIGGETITCSGDLTGPGVVGGVIVVPTDIDVLDVSGLNGSIMPGALDEGILFNRALGDMRAITLNSDADISSAESGTFGIMTRSGGGPVTVGNTGDISVSNVGIRSFGGIDGETKVTNSGMIEAGMIGIRVTRSPDSRADKPVDQKGNVTVTTTETSDVWGDINAIAVEFGEGAVGDITIDAKGELRSDGGGIKTQHSGDGNVSIENDATITSLAGIVMAHDGTGNLELKNSTGRIESTSTAITGFHIGAGLIDVTSNGVIDSGGGGISLSHTGVGKITATSTGTITSIDTAILVSHVSAGDIDVTNNGVIDSGAAGIVLFHTGAGKITATSTGTITSAGPAINVSHIGAGDIDITSNGAIASGADGIFASHSGAGSIKVVASGGIIARDDGIEVLQLGGGAVSVTASGDIKARDDGIRIQFSSAAPLTESNVVLQGGLVEGLSEGIEFVGAGSVGDQANVLTITGTQEISGRNHDVLGGIGNELIDNHGELTSLGAIDLGGGANRFENRAGSLFNSGDLVDLGAGNPFINAGRVSPFGLGAMGTTTIVGNWVGENGSVLEIDTVLNDGIVDETDVLSVEGDASGTTLVLVNIVGGEGAQTGQGSTDGIKITDISGASDGTFELGGGFVQAGAFEYGLFQADGQDWYLQTESLSDPAILAPYVAYSLQTFGLRITGTFNERTGSRVGWRPDIMNSSSFSSSADLLVEPQQSFIIEDVVEEASTRFGTWARIIGAWSDANGTLADGFANVSYDETQWATQAGFDAIVSEGDNGTFVASAFLHYGQISTNSTNRSTGRAAGSTYTNGWGGGGALTYATSGGLYLDGVATYTHYDLDVAAGTGAISSTDGDGWTLSGEAGWRIALGDQVAMTPQAQLVYQDIAIDATTDSTGVMTRFSAADSLEGRLGTTLEYVPAMGNVSTRLYAEANLVNEFLNDPIANVSGTPLVLGFNDSGYEVGLGAEFGQNGDGLALWAEGDYRAPFDANDGINTWSATGGIAIRF